VYRAIALAILVLAAPAAAANRNVILFVPDGLRAASVNEIDAPAMSDLRTRGVTFANSISVYPTLTMVNAAAFATHHLPGDTGVFGNTLYLPAPIALDAQRKTNIAFIESDPTLRALQAAPGGFLGEETLMAAARRAGYATAAVGKHGPAALQHIDELDDDDTVIIDDATNQIGKSGEPAGVRLADDIENAIVAATGQRTPPSRRQNSAAGNCETPGTMAPNLLQQDWFTQVTTDVVLPRFKAADKPFFLIYWSRDPDGTQHNQGDSDGRLVPGINGPTSRAAIRNADEALRRIRNAVQQLGLADTTDIIIAADHGFSTVAKESKTSASATLKCGELTHALPQGFLAMDVAAALNMRISDPDSGNSPIQPIPGNYSKFGNAVLGENPDTPDVVIAANGGSDLIYLPSSARKSYAQKIVRFLLTQDYVSGIFVDDAFGKIPGTLPLSAINMNGSGRTLRPAMIVNFRSFATGCANPLLCAATVVDASYVQGQGMHGSLSRADTNNFIAAIGPDFKAGYVNRAPSSNADVATTIAQILGLNVPSRGKLKCRVLTEALAGGAEMPFTRETVAGPPAGGLATTLVVQKAGGVRYVETGGFPGRTVGLDAKP
jgi:arylsulfatase A-like enzyme